MTQEEILQYNKRCAEFLGAIYSKHAEAWGFGNAKNIGSKMFHGVMYHNVIQAERFEKELKFHSDWNWIMEVVEAIEKLQIPNYINEKGFKSDLLKRIHTSIEYGLEVRKNESFYGYICIITCFTFSGHQFKGYSKISKKEAVVEAINQFLIWYEKNK